MENKLIEKVKDLEAEVLRMKKIMNSTFGVKIDRRKPDWWNQIKINLGDLGWEQVILLEDGIRSVIKHDLTQHMNRVWSLDRNEEPLTKLNKIVNLLHLLKTCRQYAYDVHNHEQEKMAKTKKKLKN